LTGEPGGAEDGAICHASCVAFGERAALIRGRSGSGKSGLALRLIAMGASLVADDRTLLRRAAGQVHASAPAAIRGLIEARGIGLLRLPPVAAHVAFVVDMDACEAERLPPPRSCDIMDVPLPLYRNVPAPHFPATLFLLLRQDCRHPTGET